MAGPKKAKSIRPLIACITFFVLSVAFVTIFGLQVPFSPVSPDGLEQEAPVQSDDLPVINGYIQGGLDFPTEPFPEYMKVFAYNLDTEKEYWVDSGGKKTYRLEVPPGRYHVYAFLDVMPTYRAYFNEFVVSGMEPGCGMGQPVVVEVYPGQVTDGVNPVDWYHYIDDRFYERHG